MLLEFKTDTNMMGKVSSYKIEQEKINQPSLFLVISLGPV